MSTFRLLANGTAPPEQSSTPPAARRSKESQLPGMDRNQKRRSSFSLRGSASIEPESESLRAELDALRAEMHEGFAALRAENARLRVTLNRMRDPAEIEREEREEREAHAETAAEEMRGECGFMFISASYIRTATCKALPDYQTLKATKDALVRRKLSKEVAYRGGYTSKLLAVCHLWDDKYTPDTDGCQFRAIQAYVRTHASIEGVWYDFSCLPWVTNHAARAEGEMLRCRRMLENVDHLFLGCSVLVLAEGRLLSRFWPQYECWLAFQEGSTGGLRASHASRRRWEMVSVREEEEEANEEEILSAWEHRTCTEAGGLLGRSEVEVTRPSDKAAQLQRIRKLDYDVRAAWSSHAAAALKESGVAASDLPIGFSEEALRDGGYTSTDVFARHAALLSAYDSTVREDALRAIEELEPEEREAAAYKHGLEPEAFTPEVVEVVKLANEEGTSYEDGRRRAAAVDRLGRMGAVVQQVHASIAVSTLSDTDTRVRMAAMHTVGQISGEALNQHSSAITAKLDDADANMRRMAVQAISRLGTEAQAREAQTIVAKLDHADPDVRKAASVAMGSLDSTALIEHASMVAAKLDHPDERVRAAALETIGRLTDPKEKAKYTPVVIQKLEDNDWSVRMAAVQAAGALHIGALESRLSDEDWSVRIAAVQALAALEPSEFAKHAKAVVDRLEDSHWLVRRAVAATIGEFSEGMMPKELQQRAGTLIAKILSEGSIAAAATKKRFEEEIASPTSLLQPSRRRLQPSRVEESKQADPTPVVEVMATAPTSAPTAAAPAPAPARTKEEIREAEWERLMKDPAAKSKEKRASHDRAAAVEARVQAAKEAAEEAAAAKAAAAEEAAAAKAAAEEAKVKADAEAREKKKAEAELTAAKMAAEEAKKAAVREEAKAAAVAADEAAKGKFAQNRIPILSKSDDVTSSINEAIDIAMEGGVTQQHAEEGAVDARSASPAFTPRHEKIVLGVE